MRLKIETFKLISTWKAVLRLLFYGLFVCLLWYCFVNVTSLPAISQVGWVLSHIPSGPHVRTDDPRRLKPRSQVTNVVVRYDVPPDWSTVPLVTAGSTPQSEKARTLLQALLYSLS